MASAIDPTNPLYQFRENVLRKSRREAAYLTGTTYQAWYEAEAGLKPPTKRLLSVLDYLGHNGAALLSAYHTWVAARSARLVARELEATR